MRAERNGCDDPRVLGTGRFVDRAAAGPVRQAPQVAPLTNSPRRSG